MPEANTEITDTDEPDVRMSFTFIDSGTQMQQLFVGLTPMVVIEPEIDEEENVITFITRAVDVDGPGELIDILEVIITGLKQGIDDGQFGEVAEPETVAGESV